MLFRFRGRNIGALSIAEDVLSHYERMHRVFRGYRWYCIGQAESVVLYYMACLRRFDDIEYVRELTSCYAYEIMDHLRHPMIEYYILDVFKRLGFELCFSNEVYIEEFCSPLVRRWLRSKL